MCLPYSAFPIGLRPGCRHPLPNPWPNPWPKQVSPRALPPHPLSQLVCHPFLTPFPPHVAADGHPRKIALSNPPETVNCLGLRTSSCLREGTTGPSPCVGARMGAGAPVTMFRQLRKDLLWAFTLNCKKENGPRCVPGTSECNSKFVIQYMNLPS